MTTLAARSFRELFAAAASTEPTPGGGSVTALCGMMGVALVLKALRISVRWRDDAGSFEAAASGLEDLASRIAAHADADAEAFAGFIAALKLPKATPQEAEARARGVDDASAHATDVALKALADADDAIRRSRGLDHAVSAQLRPDLEAGLALLEAMRLNAIHNAEGNIAAVKDAARREALAARLAALKAA